MTRVLIGDALVNEDERLQSRVNHSSTGSSEPAAEAARLRGHRGSLPADWEVNAYANALIAFVIGPLAPICQGGFKSRHGGLAPAVAGVRGMAALRGRPFSGPANATPDGAPARPGAGGHGALPRRELRGTSSARSPPATTAFFTEEF